MERLVVKLVLFSVIDSKLNIYLKNGFLPSGGILTRKKLDETADEIFKKVFDASSLKGYLEQLYTFSSFKEGRCEIAVVYFILLPQSEIPKKIKNNWVAVEKIDKKSGEWEAIQYATQRLKWKVEYTNVVYSLLPSEFTLSELQATYEAILGRTLDKRNFRKKITSLNIIQPTGKIRKMGRARPAELYSFKKRKLTYVEIL